MAKSKASKHAKALSDLGASKGGLARREALTQAERSAIAKKAAEDRWAAAKGLPRETHSGVLKLGDGLPCSVLDNGMRVFSVNGLGRAFESKAKGRGEMEDGGTLVPSVLAAANIRPFISPELMSQIESPISYRGKHGGRTALGYEATIIRRMCDTLLDARAAGVLRLTQLPTARAAEALVRALADVGIVALIDEATGYQDDRARDELQRLVTAYVVEDMRPWVSLFPNAFFRQVYRIHGWPYKEGVTQGPRYVGKFINKYVYERLPPAVLAKLRALNPVDEETKRRKHKMFQFLSEDIGEPTIDRHLASITTLMTVANDKAHFDTMFKLAFPMPGEQMMIGAVVHPSLPHVASSEDDAMEEAEEEAPERSVIVDGMEISDAVGGVRERVIAAMQGRDMINSKELAKLVYGDDSEPTRNKLRIRLAQYKLQGLVETPKRGFWRLR